MKHNEPSCADIRVDALGDEYLEAAESCAGRLGLPCSGDAAYALQVGAQGLQFVELGPQAAGPVRVDFVQGAVAHRRQFGGGAGQMIARAVGLQPGVRPSVLDATAGLGRDAFVLAELGCPVIMIERQPLIAALLEDGLRRASLDAEVAPIVARMCLLRGNAIELLQAWSERAELGEFGEMSEMSGWHERLGGLPPQVIYLDPMFPHRDKSAQVKKEMRLFRPLAGDDDDAPALLAVALRLATHRVVVKRPRKAAAIAGEAPGYVLEGKSSRYDIYPKKALRAKK